MPSIIDDPDFIPLTIEDLNTISQAEFDERVGHRLDAAPLYRALGKCVASGEFDDHFPDAERIRVVLDNLATHTPAALYTAFPPAEARRILAKLDFHFTPKHASWLNRVEIELSVLVKQCLNRRIADLATLAC